jgi:hypothetical protein
MSPPFKSSWEKAAWLALAGACLAAGSKASAQSSQFGGDPTSSAFIRIPDNTDDWTRHFRLGAVVGLNIGAKFGLSGNYNFGVNGGASKPGVYDDGYVLTDKSGDPNYTSYWGYNNASQYNAANNTLSYHSASMYTLPSSVHSSDDGGAFPGLDLSYGGNLWYWKHARIGWEVGFGLLPIEITDRNTYNINVQQSTFVYSLSPGLVVPTGPYNGGSSGVGPIIPTQFSGAATTNTVGTLGGSRSLDVMLYTLRLGPTIYWDISDKFAAYFGAGPAVGLADGELQYNDVITVGSTSAHSSGSVSATDFTFGYYVNGTVLYHITENADIYIGAQYMPMGSVNFNGAGRQSQLDLEGQLYISAGVHWPF